MSTLYMRTLPDARTAAIAHGEPGQETCHEPNHDRRGIEPSHIVEGGRTFADIPTRPDASCNRAAPA